ncbi:MAG: methyltransferase domain-containing protein [Pseudomonadota bacterium]
MNNFKAKGRSTRIKQRFVDQVRFVGALVTAPKVTGAVAPTSRGLAELMARSVDVDSDLPVLELGPGTGAITAALLDRLGSPNRLVCLEYDEKMCACLRKRYHGLRVIKGSAFELEDALPAEEFPNFDCVISGIPLLNFKPHLRNILLQQAVSRLAPGRPLVQFSYGVKAPIDLHPNIQRTVSPWVMKNLPPARVWSYARTGEVGNRP